jgi:hypothetical protein
MLNKYDKKFQTESERLVKIYMRSMEQHVLTMEADGSYRMGSPGRNAYSVYLVFAAGRIGITGDFRIGPFGGGCWSCNGYGLKWFSEEMEDDYLSGKFLLGAEEDEYYIASYAALAAIHRKFRELKMKIAEVTV